jgi:hypothetical protein
VKNIIIDIVLAEGIFRQPKAVNLRSPHRHRAQLQRARREGSRLPPGFAGGETSGEFN